LGDHGLEEPDPGPHVGLVERGGQVGPREVVASGLVGGEPQTDGSRRKIEGKLWVNNANKL